MEEKKYENLFKAILSLESTLEVESFLRDLCTLSEISSMAERLEVANLINQGISYRKINEITGSSTATITRVAHWLKHGKGGYSLILKRI